MKTEKSRTEPDVPRVTRRDFIATTLAISTISGCAGGGSEATVPSSSGASAAVPASAQPSALTTGSPPGVLPSSDPVISQPTPVGSTIARFELRSAAGGSLLPFALGHAFRKGDVPMSTTLALLSASVPAWSADVRNRWPDGSVKFAVLSGAANIAAGQTIEVSVLAQSNPPAASGDVSLTDLKATGVSASITFGSSTANWAGTAWDAPAATIQRGPMMSSWTYRQPLSSSPHLVAWLELRCYRGGHVEVLPWIENGFLNVPSPGEQTGRVVFSLGGSTRYDSNSDPNYTTGYNVAVVSGGIVRMAHHTRIVLVARGTTSHWLATDPQIVPRHNRSYFESTKLVPAYRPSTINESALAALNREYSPMRVHYLEEGMGATGYAQEIGMLPNQAAMYLVSGDRRAYLATLHQGFSLGSYSIHYRDETTNRPPLFATYPSTSINSGALVPPAPTGAQPYFYAPSHHPSAAYLPYLTTGWNWFAEELQFQATLHYLAQPVGGRQGANHYFTPSAHGAGLANQGGPRATAWVWRTCAMAASVTPDSDGVLRGQFVTALNFNANFFRVEHETGAVGRAWAPNNLGCVAEPGYSGQSGKIVQAPWQDDFVTASVGLTWDLEVITDVSRQADLRWFRDFKYKAVVGRLGQQNVTSEWSFRRGAQYNIDVGLGTGSASTFNWHASWGDAFTSYFGVANTGSTGTDLIDGNIGGLGMSTSYWGNVQPAIAYAVDHGAAGAEAAYARMIGASNFASKADEFRDVPVWGIRPRSR